MPSQNLENRMKSTLQCLLDSSDLDPKALAGDILESFDHSDWEPRPGLTDGEKEKFDEILQNGEDGSLEPGELKTLFSLADDSCLNHTLFYVFEAKALLLELTFKTE